MRKEIEKLFYPQHCNSIDSQYVFVYSELDVLFLVFSVCVVTGYSCIKKP